MRWLPGLQGQRKKSCLLVSPRAWCFALTWLFVRWDDLRLSDVGASIHWTSLLRLVVGVVIGLVLIGLHSLTVATVGHVDWIRNPDGKPALAALFGIAYLCLAAREELAFHGYPLRRLQQMYGVGAAQLLIAAVFALEHLAGGWSYQQALWGAFVGSLLFGMASIATRGLAVPIGVHAAWNFGDWLRGNRAAPAIGVLRRRRFRRFGRTGGYR